MDNTGHIVLQQDGQWFTYSEPVEILQTDSLQEVEAILAEIDVRTQAGAYAAGFVAYEAASAFDHCLKTRTTNIPGPLIWFALFSTRREGIHPPEYADDDAQCSDWQSGIDKAEFTKAIAQIKDYIASGDTYQVNYTFPLTATFTGNPWLYFEQLIYMQQVQHAAYIDLGDHVLCSASPELFFKRKGTKLTCRPMKGTAVRGLTYDGDEAQYYQLEHSPKDQSENIMIVDMIRNDLGKIAEPGSVETTRIFDVEKYQTVFQMISEVQAKSDAGLVNIFKALFPCASITGAPKVRTMEIIHELESTPRGVYTGCIGAISPNRQAEFNVAIRTVSINRNTGSAQYHTGAGIVWDSDTESEYEECLTKTKVLSAHWPAFSLLESILWEPDQGFLVLPEHYRRLSRSAKYFDYAINLDQIDQDIKKLSIALPNEPHRLRILVHKDGTHDIETHLMPEKQWHFNVTLDSQATNSQNTFLYHKTTMRDMYETARARHPDKDDVILWNEHGQLTESTMANLVLRFGEDYFTPPVSCGLLNGAFRQNLINMETLQEKVLYKEDLERADEVLLVNAVRKWIRVSL